MIALTIERQGDEMKITIIGAGNSGLAMAAHLSIEGHEVTLWNRTVENIQDLLDRPYIHCSGVINGKAYITCVTNDLSIALEEPEIIFVTTPAFSHAELAAQFAIYLTEPTTIILNPGRTFGALEFQYNFHKKNPFVYPIIAETQTILYTCRKITQNEVEIYALKHDVLISTISGIENKAIIKGLPTVLQDKFIPAASMIETSIGNVGMIMHCAPLLLNTGWVESENDDFNYYRTGISQTVANFIEKMDNERIEVAKKLGHPVEPAMEWMKRTYDLEGDNLYAVIQNNEAYATISAPRSLGHRYIMEDIPTGLVPLEAVGKELGLEMKTIGLIIDLASVLMEIDFRKEGRNLHELIEKNGISAKMMLN